MTADSNTYGPVIPSLVSDGPEMQGPSGGGGWGRVRGEGEVALCPSAGWDVLPGHV